MHPFPNYQPKLSFYIINEILRLFIAIQFVLVFFRVFLRNQETFFLSDCFNGCMMILTYYQKNYCLALVTMFYDFSLIYLNVIFFLWFVQYHLPFFIDENRNFTLMLIFSTVLYVCESIMLFQAYKEYKGIIYDINQAQLEQIEQEEQPNLDFEIPSSIQEQSFYLIRNNQLQEEQRIGSQQIIGYFGVGQPIQERTNNQRQEQIQQQQG
ncbi:unnamed protein product [Paramecium octaurelia]|uniref:Transmembrane protein n=1 Tax=Paramecium octaurelia TaxID=43137 RepID=A0A8S1TL81_PAROT|nr:unnamed protein product [Paramecium octaurelia]